MLIRVVFVLMSWQLHVMAQSKLIRMPAPINHPGINVSSPFVSLDGNSLLFVSDNAEDNALTVFYSFKGDGINWKEPVALPRSINTRLGFLRGYALSSDGKQLFITTIKSGGLGGYDLFVSDQRGAFWSEPVNIGLPVNSKGNDASPSLSTDATTLYFMRCAKMDAYKAGGCAIWMTTRKSPANPWTEPVQLPANINKGNSQTPRIMGDGETLIFSSDQFGGKGGMELLLSRKQGSMWTDPVLLDFANSEGDDQYVSANSLGRYLMRDAPGKMANELVEILFPPELKPKGVMKVEGKIQGPETPVSAYVNVFDKSTGTKIFNTRPSKDGVFTLYLKEGATYELAIDPEKDNYTFYSREFDLAHDKVSSYERIEIALKPVVAGDAIELAQVGFKPYSSELTEVSTQELQRLVRLMRGSTSVKYVVEVSQYGFLADSVASNPELTESLTDTLRFTITRTSTDSTGAITTATSDSVAVRRTYHNDRSSWQALELVNYLIAQGVPSSALLPASRVFAVIPEERRTLIRVVAR